MIVYQNADRITLRVVFYFIYFNKVNIISELYRPHVLFILEYTVLLRLREL